MANFIKKSIKRVAVIGSGPGGIAAARALRDEGSFDTITIFERSNHTGGTWYYTPETNPPPPFPSTDALQVDTTLQMKQLYSPIYANLHTNLPHSVMSFQDVPFPNDTPNFPSHTHVMNYLSQLVKDENLLPWIRFSTMVENAEYENNAWKVTLNNNGKTYTEEFDALVVATGHYSVPYVPEFPGLDKLAQSKKVQLLHSRDYRQPKEFKGKTILVIGGGSSANDIVRETSSVAAKVYQCIRTQTELSRQAVERAPPNVHQVALVDSFKTNDSFFSVELQDNSNLTDVDVIIFGTGYLYSFPFLPFQKDNLIKTGQKVLNLNQYMFYKKNPTLCFLGLPIRVVPLPLMQRQSIVMARYWSGKIPMYPSLEEGASKTDDEDDDRLDFIMGVAKEFDYDERLGAWAQGWTESDRENWQSEHPVTGRLSEQWKELRKNALSLRREYLGY